MNRFDLTRGVVFAIVSCFALTANLSAHIVSVTGDGQIIAAPPQVLNDGVTNLHQQGFNEMQNVLLAAPLAVDGGTIGAGTVVDSHMIFLNQPATNVGELDDLGIKWTFDGAVLGVMSDTNGTLEVATEKLLGAAGTTYPTAPYYERGLEFNDSYSVVGNTITVNMHVFQPGDWIRVVTQGKAGVVGVPEPGTYLSLMSFLLFGYGLEATRRRKLQNQEG